MWGRKGRVKKMAAVHNTSLPVVALVLLTLIALGAPNETVNVLDSRPGGELTLSPRGKVKYRPERPESKTSFVRLDLRRHLSPRAPTWAFPGLHSFLVCPRQQKNMSERDAAIAKLRQSLLRHREVESQVKTSTSIVARINQVILHHIPSFLFDRALQSCCLPLFPLPLPSSLSLLCVLAPTQDREITLVHPHPPSARGHEGSQETRQEGRG